MKLTHLKALSLRACESLNQISSEASHVLRQARCAEFLHYAIDPADFSMALNRANFCGRRTCPVCTWLKSTKWRIRLFAGLPRLLTDYPDSRFLLLTLTVRNCHIGQLRSTIRVMEQGWRRLSNLPNFPAIGYLKSLELARPRDCFYYGIYIGRLGHTLIERWIGHLKKQPNWNPLAWRSYWCEEVHPHFHALLMIPSSYFSEGEYINQAEWRSLWKRSARLDYDPIVDIRAVKELRNGILETSKYCLKTQDMVDVLGCLTIRQLHGLRLISIGGALNDYCSQAALDAIAATGELGTEHWQQGVPCYYEWNGKKYVLTRLAHLEWEIA